MKFFMSSLTFNILSSKCSDEKKLAHKLYNTKTLKVQRMEEIVGLVVKEIDVMARKIPRSFIECNIVQSKQLDIHRKLDISSLNFVW